MSALVFVDYDGTLLTAARQLSPRTREALWRASSAGLFVVPASGRPLSGLHQAGTPELIAAIGLNGGVAEKHTPHDRRIWQAPGFAADVVESLIALASRHSVCVNLYTATAWYVADPGHPRVREEADRVGTEPEAGQAPLDTVQKVLLLGPSSDLDQIESMLADAEHASTLRWFRSEPEYLEIGSHAVTKATGVQIVGSWFEHTRSYAIGDGPADVPMFAAVDVGIAVGNAEPWIRDSADLVVDTNQQDGVATVLDAILKGAL